MRYDESRNWSDKDTDLGFNLSYFKSTSLNVTRYSEDSYAVEIVLIELVEKFKALTDDDRVLPFTFYFRV